jgi:hypothetical protein
MATIAHVLIYFLLLTTLISLKTHHHQYLYSLDHSYYSVGEPWSMGTVSCGEVMLETVGANALTKKINFSKF